MTTQTRFTPGKWLVTDHPDNSSVFIEVDNAYSSLIARVSRWDGNPGNREAIAEGKANAALIAASPRLYAALEALADLYDTDEGCRKLPQYIEARAALAKSRGES